MTPDAEREFELLKIRLLLERQSGMPRWNLTASPRAVEDQPARPVLRLLRAERKAS